MVAYHVLPTMSPEAGDRSLAHRTLKGTSCQACGTHHPETGGGENEAL